MGTWLDSVFTAPPGQAWGTDFGGRTGAGRPGRRMRRSSRRRGRPKGAHGAAEAGPGHAVRCRGQGSPWPVPPPVRAAVGSLGQGVAWSRPPTNPLERHQVQETASPDMGDRHKRLITVAAKSGAWHCGIPCLGRSQPDPSPEYAPPLWWPSTQRARARVSRCLCWGLCWAHRQGHAEPSHQFLGRGWAQGPLPSHLPNQETEAQGGSHCPGPPRARSQKHPL